MGRAAGVSSSAASQKRFREHLSVTGGTSAGTTAGRPAPTPKANASGIVQCHVPDLEPGSSTVITVVAKGKQLGPATTQASVSPVAPAGDPNAANNTATVSVPVTLAG